MSQRKPVADNTGRFASNQIVVDTDDLPQLREDLATLGLPFEEGEKIPRFRLGLVALGDLARLDEVGDAADVRNELREQGRAADYPEPTDLDVLLTMLRRAFEARGRRLRVGKDRDIELVEGLPHWAGIGPPRRIPPNQPEAAAPVTLQPRDAQPGRRVRVGVLDTGMYPNPSLDGRYLSSDLLEKPQAPVASWSGHALFVVGLIAQEAPGAIVEVRRVLDDETGTSTAWGLAKAMAAMMGTGVEILNVSLGCFTIDDEPPFLLERAVERTAAEMLIVAAAGNHGAGSARTDLPGPRSASSPMWPAALPDVVAVGAADVTTCAGGDVRMTRAGFTPPNAEWIKLWAKGVDLDSFFLEGEVVQTVWEDVDGKPVARVVEVPGPFNGYATWNGTSFACGVVSGRIAALAQESNTSVGEVYANLREGQSTGSCGPEDVRPGVDETDETD
jgi:hypothetical protein